MKAPNNCAAARHFFIERPSVALWGVDVPSWAPVGMSVCLLQWLTVVFSVCSVLLMRGGTAVRLSVVIRGDALRVVPPHERWGALRSACCNERQRVSGSRTRSWGVR